MSCLLQTPKATLMNHSQIQIVTLYICCKTNNTQKNKKKNSRISDSQLPMPNSKCIHFQSHKPQQIPKFEESNLQTSMGPRNEYNFLTWKSGNCWSLGFEVLLQLAPMLLP
jgi:hypothetical protein